VLKLHDLFDLARPCDARQVFYEAGSCQELVRVDWFTLLFEFPRTAMSWSFVVVSFNGATMLILRHEFFTQTCPELIVISICCRTFPLPTRA